MIRQFMLCTLLLAHCGFAVPARGQPAGGNQATNADTNAVTTLNGRWRIAALDGRQIDAKADLALRASAREIWWEPRCAGYLRSYNIVGHRFSTGPYIGFDPKQMPPPICLIAPPREIGPVFDALNAATSIRRTAASGIEISGGRHSLLLVSQ